MKKNIDYIGFVYQFGVKGMRARKHVQYQFRVGRHQFGVTQRTDYINLIGFDACQEARSVSVSGGGQA